MILKKLVVGALGVNCYIIGSEDTRECAIIDPGGNANKIINVIEKDNLKVKYILLTHGHGDHIGGVPQLKKHFKCDVLVHGDDIELTENAEHNHSDRFGDKIEFTPDVVLNHYDTLELGSLKIDVFHTPGHTQGGVVFKVEKALFVGDTLFSGSVGRYDLYGGNGRQLIQSIKNVIYKLDSDLVVYPGHGGETTIKREMDSNPYTV